MTDPTEPATPGRKDRKAHYVAVALAVVAAIWLIGHETNKRHEAAPAPRPSSSAAPTTSQAPLAAPTTAREIPCHEAPAKAVEMIEASFTNAEHLVNTQSVYGPSASVVIGGNIDNADGSRMSSRDSWLLRGGVLYALTSDARRHTLLPDGRDLLNDWTTYNDAVANCVGRVSDPGGPPVVQR